MVTATTLSPSSIIHGPATPVAGKKNPSSTETKSEFLTTPVEKKMTVDKSSSQGQQRLTHDSETHRSTRADGTEELITLQEGGVENKNPIPLGHSKKLKIAIAHAMGPTLLNSASTSPRVPFDTKA